MTTILNQPPKAARPPQTPLATSSTSEDTSDPGDSVPRIVIMGIGNETNGDDAAGVVAARALIPALANVPHVLVLDSGIAPENFTGPVRRFNPDVVLLIDAAQMDEPPGSIRLLDWQETDGMSASTHTLPPYVLGRFLVADTGCTLALIGIQPAQNAFGAPLSEVMTAAVTDVVDTLSAALA